MLLQRNPSSSNRARTLSLRRMKRGSSTLSQITSLGHGDDPLNSVLRPPKNETNKARDARLVEEADAKKRSEDIDKQLKEDASRLKTEKGQEKTILLLGQAEAGKTTIVKQMRMLYEPRRQALMRSTWTSVVFLNVILAVKTVFNTYHDALLEAQTAIQHGIDYELGSRAYGDNNTMSPAESKSKYLLAKFRLAPLLSLELDLRRSLGAFEEAPVRLDAASPKSQQSSSFEDTERGNRTLLLKAGWQDSLLDAQFDREAEWEIEMEDKARLAHARSTNPAMQFGDCMPISGESRTRHEPYGGLEPSPEQCKMQCLLDACMPEIEVMFRLLHNLHPNGSAGLLRHDSATYFLDHLHRFIRHDYVPTDDDILRARVRTVGVYEEKFHVNKHLSYRIIDVGGSVSQRNVWAQFFSDATAIIFLAPISAFDEYLTEDPRKNKIKDSLELWEAITSSALLSRVSLILFLNKIDILMNKLQAGTMVKQYFTRYSGSNSFDEVWRYFRSLFLAIANKHHDTAPMRNLYIDKTTATSTREIQVILTSCQDIILRQNLKEATLT